MHECQVGLAGIEQKYWIGKEIGRIGGYGFRGTITAGDGSDQNGINGTRICEFARNKTKAASKGGTRRGRI